MLDQDEVDGSALLNNFRPLTFDRLRHNEPEKSLRRLNNPVQTVRHARASWAIQSQPLLLFVRPNPLLQLLVLLQFLLRRRPLPPMLLLLVLLLQLSLPAPDVKAATEPGARAQEQRQWQQESFK